MARGEERCGPVLGIGELSLIGHFGSIEPMCIKFGERTERHSVPVLPLVFGWWFERRAAEAGVYRPRFSSLPIDRLEIQE